MDTRISKKELRTHLRESLKQNTDSSIRFVWSSEIVQHIKQLPLFIHAQKIALYCALWDEPDLSELLQEFFSTKELYIPKVEDNNTILFYKYKPQSTRVGGKFQIEEPCNKEDILEDPNLLELILVPGLGFDSKGHRLGRGKGYYDRFLSSIPQVPRIAVSFRCQVLDHIPTEEWDSTMNGIISEDGFQECF